MYIYIYYGRKKGPLFGIHSFHLLYFIEKLKLGPTYIE